MVQALLLKIGKQREDLEMKDWYYLFYFLIRINYLPTEEEKEYLIALLTYSLNQVSRIKKNDHLYVDKLVNVMKELIERIGLASPQKSHLLEMILKLNS